MNSQRKTSNGRQIVILIGALAMACVCLVALVSAAYFLYLRTASTSSSNSDNPPVIAVEEVTPNPPPSTETVNEDVQPATATPEPVPSAAPATLAAVTVAVTEVPTNTPTASPTPVEEPTLFVTDTPTPTATPGSGGVGIPAPRLVNHNNCQNNISVFTRNGTIEFQWTWTQRVDTDRGYYLEVQIGPRGATTLSSQGGINNDALINPGQNLWQVRIPVANFYRDTANDYEWRVAYMNNNQRVVVASSRGCFDIR